MYIGYSVSIDPVKDTFNQILTIQPTIEEVFDSVDKIYESNLKVFSAKTLENKYNTEYNELVGIIKRFAPEVMYSYENGSLEPIIIEDKPNNESERMSTELVTIKLQILDSSSLELVESKIREQTGIDFVSIEDKKNKVVKIDFTNTEVSTQGVSEVMSSLKKINMFSCLVYDINFSSSSMRELFRPKLNIGCSSEDFR